MKKDLRIPGIMNPRFLMGLLRVIVHGNLPITSLTRIKSMIDMMDKVYYSNQSDLITYLNAIDIVLQNMISGLTDTSLISNNIITSIRTSENAAIIDDLINPLIVTELNGIIHDAEKKYILGVISTYHKVGFLLLYKESLIEKFTNIESGHIGGIEKVVESLEKDIAELHLKLHKALNTVDESAVEEISLNDKEFLDSYFKYVYKNSKKEDRVLKMGLKALNSMFSKSGGALLGKMYMFNAPINSFKSSILLYIAKWIQLYNSDQYKADYERTGVVPTVLVLSFENTWNENAERLFSMYAKTSMKETDTEDSAKKVWTESFFETSSVIDIYLIHGKSRQFGPMDLERKIDELESQGRVVIATIVDYLKVMKDDYNSPDKRQQIINISTDLHELVTVRSHMALFTVHHINRDGDTLLSDAKARGGIDRVKLLGRQHLTEANAVEEPLDFSAYMLIEESPYDNNTYLTINRSKCRYERGDTDYFVHLLKNGFLLQDDINLDISLSLNSIADTGSGSNLKPITSNHMGRDSSRELEIPNSSSGFSFDK